MIGQTVSHSSILEKSGDGGMGVVYKAEDGRLLRNAIEHNYCSYTAMQTDPLLVKLRGTVEFGGLLAAAKDCRDRFLAERGTNAE